MGESNKENERGNPKTASLWDGYVGSITGTKRSGGCASRKSYQWDVMPAGLANLLVYVLKN